MREGIFEAILEGFVGGGLLDPIEGAAGALHNPRLEGRLRNEGIG